MHYRCRYNVYRGTNVTRVSLMDREVPWKYKMKRPYNPPYYTADIVKNSPEWSDPEIGAEWLNRPKPKWNLFNEDYDRQCGAHVYKIKDGYPMNPIGRTGMRGRGLLGRWGPNHAVNVIVARWKKGPDNKTVIKKGTKKPVFEVVMIKRDEDFQPWAVPGGFKKRKDTFTETAIKCFADEALNRMEKCKSVFRDSLVKNLTDFVSKAAVIYRGYVDDPRNTDNAWVSSIVVLSIDEEKDVMSRFPLAPGKGVLKVEWVEAYRFYYKVMYANHLDFLDAAADYLDAYMSTNFLDDSMLKEDDSSLDRRTNDTGSPLPDFSDSSDFLKDLKKMDVEQIRMVSESLSSNANVSSASSSWLSSTSEVSLSSLSSASSVSSSSSSSS